MKKRANKHARMKLWLFKEIQPLLEKYGIQEETILDAIEKAFREMKRERCNIRQWLLSLVCRKIFKDKRFLLINPQTPAGNKIPLDVLATAYAMWRQAQRAAAAHGMDDIDANEAMTRIVYVVADRRVRSTGKPIRDLRKYMITGYLNELRKMAKKAGIGCHTDCDPDEEISDEGGFIDALENLVLCKEVLATLPPKVRKMVYLRHMMGYSCKETAAMMDLSSNAVRKALSVGIRKYLGINLCDLRAADYVEVTKPKKKRRKSDGIANEESSVS